MFRLRCVTAPLIAVCIALAGCSSPSPEEPTATSPVTTEASAPAEETQESEPEATESAADASELSADAATGTTFEGTGYSFTAPEGWEEFTEGVAEAGLDIAVADANDTDDFADNINVVVSPAGSVTPDQAESVGVAELEGAGDFEVSVEDRVMVAGAESAHLSAAVTPQGVDYQIEQFYVTPADQTFVVTFSFSPTVSEADRNDVAESVLVTWS